MANYVKATNFFTKDALLTGNPAKIIKGAEIDDEYNAIATAINSKADTTSPTFTGSPQTPTATAGNSTGQIASTAFVTGAVGALGNMSLQNKTAVDITGGTIAGVTVAGTFTGNLTGNVTGNVTGDVTGNVTGSSGSCTGNAATATSAANAIGVSQTWQNMSASRVWSTDYTNTTGRPIMFSVTNDALDCGIELYVGGVRIGTSGQVGGGGSDYNQMSAIVPNGAVYKAVPIRGAGTVYWTELR